MNKKPTNKQSDMPRSIMYFNPNGECFCCHCGSYYEGIVVEYVIEVGKVNSKLRCPVCGKRVDGYREGEK